MFTFEMGRSMSGLFAFDPAEHKYTLDGMELISVTRVLELSGIADYRFSSEEAKTRGSFVHQATELIDRGTLDWSALDPILVPHCKAYQAFVEDVRPEILLSERPMYHAQYLFAGTLDRAMRINGRTSIVDFSTGDPPPAKRVQVATYRELAFLCGGIPASVGYTLWLRNDGAYRLSPPMDLNEMRRGLQIFLAALTVVRWRAENL